MKYNPQHDGGANEGRDRVDGQVAFKRGQARDEVAEQGQIHAEEGRGKDEQLVVAAAEQETGDMWHSQAQEGDRTAERCDDGRQETRYQDDEHAASTDVHTEVFSITLTEKQEVQGLK